MPWRRSAGRSRPVRLLEVLVDGHDGGHGLATSRHDPLVLPGIRHHVAARIDPADRRGHVRLHADEPVTFELDAPARQGRDLRLEADVDDYGVDVKDRLLQRPVVVHDGALDLSVAFEARDLGVEEHFDRTVHDGLDVLLHRPELFASVDEDYFLRGRDDLERDLEGAVATADDDHPLALELATVPYAVLDAFRLEFRFARHIQAFRLEQSHPHREDDRPALVDVPLAGRELKTGRLSLDVHDFLGPDLGAALAGMEDEQLREFAALDRDVARVVVHGLRRVQPLELAAARLRLEDQGRQLPHAGVHAGRQTRGATPDDDDVVDHGRQRQRRFLLKRCPRKGDRGTKGHGYLMMN